MSYGGEGVAVVVVAPAVVEVVEEVVVEVELGDLDVDDVEEGAVVDGVLG